MARTEVVTMPRVAAVARLLHARQRQSCAE
jgi:hypothetical protein